MNLKRFFGFYNQKRSFMKIGAYCFNPIKHLKNSSDSHDDLVCILTLIQRAVFLARSVDLLVSRDGDWNYKLILTGVLFLFSRQIAQFLLFVNGLVIHLLMRIFFRRKDLLSAERSHTYSSLALDPTYFLIYFAISLDSVVYSAIKPFHLLMITMFLRLLLKAINISVLYKTKFYLIAIATTLFSALVFSIYPTAYIPSFLSIYLSPKVLEDDIDLSVLDYRDVDIDSSFDGSSLIIDLEPLPETETNIIDSIFKKRDSIETFNIPFMNKRLKKLEPFWEVTYFDKRNLPKELWNGHEDTLHGIVKHDLITRLTPYSSLSILKIQHLLNINNNKEAIDQITKCITLFTALSKSNLGLVGSIVGAVYYNHILMTIKPHINELNDTLILNILSHTIVKHPINVECLINALRKEAHNSAYGIRKLSYESISTININPQIDSLGYYVPGIIMKKWIDPEETYLITLYTWARKINKLYQRQQATKEDLKEVNKILTWISDSRFGVKKLLLFPNTCGRIIACVGIPIYEGYFRSTEDIRRHQEFILLAIALRYYMINKGKQPETLTQIDSTLQTLSPFEFQTNYSFNYNKDEINLTSKDTIPDRKVYSINF